MTQHGDGSSSDRTDEWHPEVLHQDRIWYDREGRRQLLSKVSSDYLRKVIEFLETSASQRAGQEFVWRIETADSSEPQVFVLDLDLVLRSVEWIRRTPLVRALYAELARRGEPLEPDDAQAHG